MTTTLDTQENFPLSVAACVICQAPSENNLSIPQFECSCSVQFCGPCNARCRPILIQCPVCLATSRTPSFPSTLTLERTLELADKTISRFPSSANPLRSVRFLSKLSALYAGRLSRLYRTFRYSTAPVFDAPAVPPTYEYQIGIPCADSRELIRSHPALSLQPDKYSCLDAPKIHPSVCGAPHLPSWTWQKMEPPGYVANLYHNWVRLKCMQHGRGCIQNISCLPVNPYIDAEAMGCSQFKWAKQAVTPSLDCLLTNAVNACGIMRSRARKASFPRSERLGDFPHINAMIIVSGRLYVPTTKTDSLVRGPYVMFDDHRGSMFVPADYRNCREICEYLRLAPDDTMEQAPAYVHRRAPPSSLFTSKIMSLTQWIRSGELFGDAVLKAVHQFSETRYVRTVFSLMLDYRNEGPSTIAVAVRVHRRRMDVQPAQLMFDPDGNNTNVMPKDDPGKSEEKKDQPDDSNRDEVKDDSDMVMTNVSLIKSPIEAKRSNILYLYKVASTVPMEQDDDTYTRFVEESAELAHKLAYGREKLVLVKLAVPPAARVAISRDDSKVRVSDAVVLDIRQIYRNGDIPVSYMEFANSDASADMFSYGESIEVAFSCIHRDANMVYTKGQKVVAQPFSEDLDAVCVPGIHGCIMQSEAIGYGIANNTDFIAPQQIQPEHYETLQAIELSLNNN